MKKRISYILLLWTAFLILIINNWKNLKYFPSLIKELHKLFKKNSKYTEDGGYYLIKKGKNEKK